MPISNVNTTNYVPRPPKEMRADTLDRLQAKLQDKPVKRADADLTAQQEHKVRGVEAYARRGPAWRRRGGAWWGQTDLLAGALAGGRHICGCDARLVGPDLFQRLSPSWVAPVGRHRTALPALGVPTAWPLPVSRCRQPPSLLCPLLPWRSRPRPRLPRRP